MKATRILIAFLVTVFGHGLNTAVSNEKTNEGPIAFWSFDGALKDEAGAAGDLLTARGDVASTVAARFISAKELSGTLGSAVALGVKPGDTQYLVASISEDIRLGPSYSIAAWIHPTQLGGWNRLVLHWGGPSQYAYHLAIHNGLLSLCHGQADDKLVFCEGGSIIRDQMQHVVAVANRNDDDPANSTLAVYLNGRRTGTASFDGTIRKLKTVGLGVGDSPKLPDRRARFRGYIDEVTIWNRALSAAEIKANYREPGRAEVMQQFEVARQKAEQDRLRAEIAKRAQLFSRVKELAVEEIVFAERGYGRDIASHYYANFGYSCGDPNVWLHAADGGRLTKINVRTGELTTLVSDPSGAVRDPQVHYDAQKILFSYRKGGTHHYNLYEIGVDGHGLRQITSGPWDDIEPTYLPDGGIAFCSSRCKRYIGCWLAQSATLHRCDGDGGNIRMLSSGAFTENTPSVLPDGRILYTRWEYVNRDPVSFHHLWVMNPDGAGQSVYYGNMRPGGVFIDAVPIPGTDQVVMINSPHHGRNEHEGHVALVTDKHGPNASGALRNISASGFRDPWPLSEEAFLVARNNQVLLMNSRGECETIHASSTTQLHEPRPIIRRPRERSIPSRIDLSKTTGVLILNDVYTGRNMEGVQPGAIKKLLVLEDLPKPANFHGGGSQPIGHGVTSTLKRILGTVPVEADGSAHFEVPAMRSLYFAALDENDRSIKQMRSFVTLQPGETVNCVGCHEYREETPKAAGRSTLAALKRDASRIEPFEDVPPIMEFPRNVQPVFDRHCVKCHGNDRRDGGVSLAGDRGPVFSHSYYELFLFWQVKDTGGNPGHGSGRQPGNDKPYTTYSSASSLMKMIDGSHHDVKLTEHEERIVRLWIDSGAQYPGTYAASGTGQIGGCWGNNRPIREMADSWPSTAPAADAINRRCGSCHPPNQLPRHVTARIPLDSWGDMLSWTRPLSRYSRHRLYNLSRPDKSLLLLAALSEKAGGYAAGSPDTAVERVAEDRTRPPRPAKHPIVFADTNDLDYRTILVHIEAARQRLDEIKRFDMPGFRPNEHYIREMQRYGVLPVTFDSERDPIDVYATDDAYWRSLWHRAE
jgi:hypothetical protein